MGSPDAPHTPVSYRMEKDAPREQLVWRTLTGCMLRKGLLDTALYVKVRKQGVHLFWRRSMHIGKIIPAMEEG